MNSFKITLTGYRCFTEPLRIEIEEDFTALVGPNNSGKSAFLKMFYEARELFKEASKYHLSTGEQPDYPTVALDTITGQPVTMAIWPVSFLKNFRFQGVFEQKEVFSNVKNTPGFTLEISSSSKEKEVTYKCWYAANRQSVEEGGVVTIEGDDTQDGRDNYAGNCEEWTTITRDLGNSFYIGPYRDFTCRNKEAQPYYDLLVGTQFISKWRLWKAGKLQQEQKLQEVTSEICRIFGFKTLHISGAEDGETFQLVIDDKSYKLTEVGTGLAQFIMVLGNLAMCETKPSYILIDEPELNLHPSLQMEFLLNLRMYAEKGVIFATHSMGLARAVAARIYTFQKREGKTSVKPFGSPKDYAEFLKDMSISSYTELGFEKVLLVEGPSEIKTIQEFLRKKKQDHRVLLLPLGGDALINVKTAHELSEFKRISDNIFALVDREEGTKQTQHEEFKNNCEDIGIECHILTRRALENYFTEAAVQRVLRNQQAKELGLNGKPNDSNFSWKNYGYGKTTHNWKIAQEMEWTDIKDTDLGIFLDKICN